MQTKKIPLRKCTGCNEMKSKKELVRVVKNNEGDISLDTTGRKAGRGAYLCISNECFNKARKQRGLERAFSCRIDEEIYNQVEAELETLLGNKTEGDCG